MEFLFAGYGLAVSGGGVERPLLDRCDYTEYEVNI